MASPSDRPIPMSSESMASQSRLAITSRRSRSRRSENWQSELLQLFSFVVLAALFIHKGSSESKDSGEKVEASLRRIQEKVGTLLDGAPKFQGESWRLPETPLEM
jgi:hypothetical protein